MDSLNFYNEILDEIKAEERAEEKKRKTIIKNGCPHMKKIKRKKPCL